MPFQPPLPFDAPAEPSRDVKPAPPGGWLIEELAGICRERPLEEKILVAPSLLVGHTMLERLARWEGAWTHLRVETVRTLAHAVIGPTMAREGLTLLSRAQALALIEQACSESLTSRSYFGPLRERPGFHRALHASLDELRAAGLSAEELPPQAFADGRKHREISAILRRYSVALAQSGYLDGIEVLRRAVIALDVPAGADRPICILPLVTELSAIERLFLEKFAGKKLLSLAPSPENGWAPIARRSRLRRCAGEENEIRQAFRDILREGVPFDDVEILHTDPSVYPSLIWELASEAQIPCTFSGGVAATATRPGRTALAFLDWIGADFSADVLRQALASGALSLAGLPEEGPGARAAARAVRDAGIGWGRDRHLRCMDRLIRRLAEDRDDPREDAEADERTRMSRRARRERRREAAQRARQFLSRALELAPSASEGPGDIRSLASGTRSFVGEFGRVADELDATARAALDKLFAEIEELVPLSLTIEVAVARLRDAVAELSIAADRPRPGRIHVAFHAAGGFSGRRHAFLVGLDENRHPGQDLEDPVLLDEERERLNEAMARALLSLGRARPRETTRALKDCLARLPGELTLSYSSFGLRHLSMSGHPGASPFFLELYRESSGQPGADYRDLAAALPLSHAFVPEETEALSATEWWLARIRAGFPGSLASVVRVIYPWLQRGAEALEARASDAFTQWDGRVLGATPELDPRQGGEPFSASRIQTLAQCPFLYFARHVLDIKPPEDLARDPSRWLEPMQEGSLLHEVFRDFFSRIGAAQEKPRLDRHWELIETIARERIADWSERFPPRSHAAFDHQCENILFACRTFLRREEEHCRDVTPRFFEIPFGMTRGKGSAPPAPPGSAEAVEISVGKGRSFPLRGSIDRVDEASDGSFHVWDYKTGGAWSVREGLGLRGGRQIQSALYGIAFESLLERAGRPGRVSRSGYFFPGRKGEGQRIAASLDRAETRDVLDRLFDLIAAGAFPHAFSAEDCKNCELESICGGAAEAGKRARAKLEASAEPALIAFRELHAPSKD